MALYYNWDVKNAFAFALQFFSLISEGIDGGGQDGKVWDGKEKLKNGTRENVMMHKFKVKRRKA